MKRLAFLTLALALALLVSAQTITGPVVFYAQSTSAWDIENYVLQVGEVGFDTDIERYKDGNGADLWAALPWRDAVYYDTIGSAQAAQGAAETLMLKRAQNLADLDDIGAAISALNLGTAAMANTSAFDAAGSAAAAQSYAVQRSNHTGTQAQNTITGLVSDLASKEPAIAVGTSAQYLNGAKEWVTFPTNNTAFTNGAGYLTNITSG
jgi:hypothetical protein